MPNASDILWFKTQFKEPIERAAHGTPFDLDMFTALACQETGDVWPELRRAGLPVERVLALCVGDTLDADGGRSVFPRSREDLERSADGARMFQIAHQALVDMARYVPGYRSAARRADKFCRGFGIFQYDLQYLRTDAAFFLDGGYADFARCLEVCLAELVDALHVLGWSDRTQLSDLQMAYVAIVYNTGRCRLSNGLKQGYRDGSGRYYGENFYDVLLRSRAVVLPLDDSTPGKARMPSPSALQAQGRHYAIAANAPLTPLRTAAAASASALVQGARRVIPARHVVRALDRRTTRGFREVETVLAGAYLRGFIDTRHLQPETGRDSSAGPDDSAALRPHVPAAYAPSRTAGLTRRTQSADAHSLNEPGQPGRTATTPSGLCAELAAIIAWLDVEDSTHIRYRPRDGLTFCNVYAHDYCHLSGVYLPRVWWTSRALVDIARGLRVEPSLSSTLEEVRANGLFAWLRDFGAGFGWRQTGTLTKLQQHANQGGVALIVARRNEEGKPGHIAFVVPEDDRYAARRDASGEVTQPVQSQAGATNYRYAVRPAWWTNALFAESAFWIHA